MKINNCSLARGSIIRIKGEVGTDSRLSLR